MNYKNNQCQQSLFIDILLITSLAQQSQSSAWVTNKFNFRRYFHHKTIETYCGFLKFVDFRSSGRFIMIKEVPATDLLFREDRGRLATCHVWLSRLSALCPGLPQTSPIFFGRENAALDPVITSLRLRFSVNGQQYIVECNTIWESWKCHGRLWEINKAEIPEFPNVFFYEDNFLLSVGHWALFYKDIEEISMLECCDFQGNHQPKVKFSVQWAIIHVVWYMYVW